jgi:hypothetical protein
VDETSADRAEFIFQLRFCAFPHYFEAFSDEVQSAVVIKSLSPPVHEYFDEFSTQISP